MRRRMQSRPWKYCRSKEMHEWPAARERRRRSSEEERGADALALGAEEGRDKLRKAAGRGKCPSIRGCPNGETRTGRSRASLHESIVQGGEPGELKHLSTRRKRKKHRFRK